MNKKMIKKAVQGCISLLMTSSLIFEVVSPIALNVGKDTVYAAWDGYAGSDEIIKSYALFNFSNPKDFITIGEEPAEIHTQGAGYYSIYWKDQEVNKDVRFNQYPSDVPTDWSGTQGIIKMNVYSAKATGAELAFVVLSSPNDLNQPRYYREYFTVDWEGWKELKFVLQDMYSNRNPDITQMTGGIQIYADGGYETVADPETELWISSLELLAGGNMYNFTESFYEEEKIGEAISSLKNSVAVYAQGANAVTDEGKIPLEYEIDYKDKTVMIPIDVLGDFLGAEICGKDGKYSIKFGNKTLWGKIGETQVNLDSSETKSEAKTLGRAPYEKNSLIYVPGEEIAKLLEIPAFSDGRFLCMGTEEMVSKLRRPANLGINEYNEIISQLAYEKEVDIEAFTPEDAKQAKDRWREMIVGSESINDMNDPDISAKVKEIEVNAERVRSKLIKENPEATVFEDIPMETVEQMQKAYEHILDLTKAYACAGSAYYHDETLLKDIRFCLDFMEEHYYSNKGRASWQMKGDDNWFEWYIGVPYQLVQILICIEDKLTEEEIEDYLHYYYSTMAFPYDTGANKADSCLNVMGAALLQNDYKKVVEMTASVLGTYLYVDDGLRSLSGIDYISPYGKPMVQREGFFTDGSYIMHWLFPYTGGYGIAHYDALVEFEAVITGTPFEINNPLKYNVPAFFLDSFNTISYGTAFFTSIMGRQIQGGSYKKTDTILPKTFMLAENYDEATKNEIYAIIKDTYIDTPYKEGFIKNLPINFVKKFKDMIEDDNVKALEEVKMSKTFHNMDRVVHKRDDWATSIAMSSSRIFNYECINGMNLRGWYQADGRTEWLIKDTDTNLTSEYWNTINPYRLPGTTVDTQKRKEVSVHLRNSYLSSKNFVGGASLNNEYSIAAMELESQHFDTDHGTASNSQTTLNPAHKNDLTAKKAYFMTDDAVICLGTDVNASDNNNAEVLTIVENVLSSSVMNYSENSVSLPEYDIVAVDGTIQEEENIPQNTIDGSYSTKWAGVNDEYVIWDIGESKILGFINLAFQNGDKRTQKFDLQVSSDGNTWETVFSGSSSGTTTENEAFDLKGTQGRYIKFINYGNSTGSEWVSLTETSIYPPNTDGSIGVVVDEVYGANPLYTVNGEAEIYGEDVDMSGLVWANYDNQCGYWFPQNNKTEQLGNLKARRTKGNSSYLEIWYSHGVNPEKGGYAYALLPGSTAEETKTFADKESVEILANNSAVQAARDKRTNVTYIVFWQAGTFNGITVEKPGLVITRETDDKYEISVSDPTQLLTANTIKINKPLTAIELDECAKAVSGGETTTISLDMTISPGRSLECIFGK